ncbi:MAG: anaerobic ribonucleoside-triphosphate reductase activating protein [Fusobacterium sp. JB021]|nr:anaerobic ribonucleoside-triphosphate reductase activating protein [Fusobacterium sp. JB021]MDP0505781.1 anaerobic ribonucleoside-triphosphate reductase activating protein [Fusobacterium sp. JB019]
MKFGGIQKTSTIDFPKKLSCVVFTLGCDLDCFYCHNRQLIETGEEISEKEIKAFLEKRRGLLDGVVVSGGEATLQKDLLKFFKYLKKLGYATKLDSNGQSLEVIKKLNEAKVVDYFAIDLKGAREKYTHICGERADYEKTAETIRYLFDAKANFEVRTTLYPGITKEDLISIAKDFENFPLWRFNYFHMPEKFKKCDLKRLRGKVLTKYDMIKIKKDLNEYQKNLEI